VAYVKESPIAISDVSRAIQSMILTAWADGVGSNWTGFGGLEGVRKAVGLPDDYEVLASSRSAILRGRSRESRSAATE